jgi:hypothetical protein
MTPELQTPELQTPELHLGLFRLICGPTVPSNS